MPRTPLLAILLLGLLAPDNAEAYLDPGTGSAIIQMVVASVMGALFLLKVYWQKLVKFFSMGSAEKSEQDSQPASDERD